MARSTPEEVLNTVPHIVERFYNEDGRLIGWIADNYVDERNVEGALKAAGEIWAESERRKAAACEMRGLLK